MYGGGAGAGLTNVSGGTGGSITFAGPFGSCGTFTAVAENGLPGTTTIPGTGGNGANGGGNGGPGGALGQPGQDGTGASAGTGGLPGTSLHNRLHP